jgi:geranyl-CoA carboxylase alpha subunit
MGTAAPPFSTVLVANRGEIARRIIRAARCLGYRSVAVYSEADAHSPHVDEADCAVPIGPASPAASYLDIPRLIAAARLAGADAVHPGYGFLAESAEFAEACTGAGLTFIGPPAAAIRLMGNKRLAKLRMQDASVPCVPGYDGADQSEAALLEAATRIGMPIMVKAAAGGGGRGMRLVQHVGELPSALRAARAEALAAFGNGELILERALSSARHVEVQVLADRHGNVVHLGERDCSAQRRHQKVIEETPSPAVTPEIREALGRAAVDAARAIDYVGAGTVEFLLSDAGGIHFIEMNTRLQVEHPVTEMVTGLDLVALQLDIAAGKPLPFRQRDVRMTGHAIEARLCAEDPVTLLGTTGRVERWCPPTGEGIRVDGMLEDGVEIGSHYDSLLAKIIAHGSDRDEARRRLERALERCLLLGVTSNKAFLLDVLRHPAFATGVTTDFIERHLARREPALDPAMAALASVVLGAPRGAAAWSSSGELGWEARLAWRGEALRLAVQLAGSACSVNGPGWEEVITPVAWRDGSLTFLRLGRRETARFWIGHDELWLDWDGRCETFSVHRAAGGLVDAPPASGDNGNLAAPVSGTVTEIFVGVGDVVEPGQSLLVVEAMKVRHQVASAAAGRVQAVHAECGGQVRRDQLLIELELHHAKGLDA